MYKAAVIGCGRIGFRFEYDKKRNYPATHTAAYNAYPKTKIVGVCDTNDKYLKECSNYWQTNAYTNISELCRKECPDIISICTPPQTHYKILKEIAKFSPKAIFCEKPISYNLKTAKKMVEACKDKGIILQINHQRRFDSLHNKIRDIIRKKEYGEVQQVTFYYTAGINNTGSHMFDLLNFIFGKPKSIRAIYSKNTFPGKNDFNVDGWIEYEDKTNICFKALDARKFLIFELDIMLEKARLIIANSGFSLKLYKPNPSKIFDGYQELQECKIPFNTKYKRNFMVNAIKEIVNCIESGKETISSGKDGLIALKLIFAAITSAKSKGKKISLKVG